MPTPPLPANDHPPLGLGREWPADKALLLASARTLQQAARTGSTQQLLRGRNLALLCEVGHSAEAARFQRAATGLGAHVAQVRPSLTDLSTRQDVEHTARMLGRLYAAVECQGLSAALVQHVGLAAGVPVYDSLASDQHPTARLVDLLGGDESPGDKRHFVLQAALLATLT